MAINLPQITKAERTNALFFFILTLIPAVVLFFIDIKIFFGFLICVGLRYVELFIINKYGDKLQ
jgi:hypothetical protein